MYTKRYTAGDALLAIVKEKRLTQKQLAVIAQSMGYAREMGILNTIRRKNSPSVASIIRIAEAFGCEVVIRRKTEGALPPPSMGNGYVLYEQISDREKLERRQKMRMANPTRGERHDEYMRMLEEMAAKIVLKTDAEQPALEDRDE